MAAADYYSQIQQAYIAYYGRPADPDGLEFWAGELDKANGDLAVIIDAFGNSEESQELYGADTPAAQVNKIYQTLFGRPADMEGLQYYVNGLRTGEFSLASVALDVYNGARNEDKAALEAKLAYAEAFTGAIDTVEELLGYSGKAAAQAARDVLDTVKDEASLETALETVDEAVSGVVESGNAGETINLTADLDTVVGTDANDVINAREFNATTGAPEATLTDYDTIDGGKGNDTLNIFTAGGENTGLPATATVKNVETINFYGNGIATVDASRFVGATAINQLGGAASIDVTNLAATTTAGFQDLAAADIKVGAAEAATTAAVKLTKVDDASTVTVSGAALNSVKLSGAVVDTAAADGVGAIALTVNAGKDVETVKLDTAVAVDLSVANVAGGTKTVTTIDAAASTGAVNYTATTVTNLTTGSGNDVVSMTATLNATTKTASLKTGAGNDELTVTATGVADAGNTITVDAGAGDDKITLTAINAAVAYNINAGEGDDTVVLGAGVLKTTDVVDGGAGNDTISLNGKTAYTNADYVVLTKQVKNFEAVEFTGAAVAGSATAIDAGELSAYKSFTFTAAGNNQIADVAADQALIAKAAGLTAAAAGYVAADGATPATYAGSLNVTANGGVDATPLAIDLLAKDAALTVNAGTVGSVVALGGDLQTATITLNNGVDDVDTPTVDIIAEARVNNTSELAGLTTLTLKGTGTATVVNADGTALTTVDASALAGKVTIEGADLGKALAGLDYTSDNAKAETIKLGAGVDIVTLNASTVGALSAKTFDTVEGLNFVLNEDGDALVLGTDVLELGGFVRGTDSFAAFTTSQTDFDLALQDAANVDGTAGAFLAFAFGGDTYLYIDAGNDGYTTNDTLVKLVGVSVDDAVVAMNSAIPTPI
ncbi:DUF4214 domain-containing protein [Paracidovorax citrulli]